MLPDDATMVTVTRRALIPENGTDHALTMTISSLFWPAPPLIEKVNIRETLSLTLPELGGGRCFIFMNEWAPSEIKMGRPYLSYSQIVNIQVR